MPTLQRIYKWMNENRALWFGGIIGTAIGIRIGIYFGIDPNHFYTLYDMLWGTQSSTLSSLFSIVTQ